MISGWTVLVLCGCLHAVTQARRTLLEEGRSMHRGYPTHQETQIKVKGKIQNLSDRYGQIKQESRPLAGANAPGNSAFRTDSITEKTPESKIAPKVLPSANTQREWLLMLLYFDDSAPVAGASSSPVCGGENMFSVAIAVDVCMPTQYPSYHGYNKFSVIKHSDTSFTYTLTNYDDVSCASNPTVTTTDTITTQTCYATDPDLYQIPSGDLSSSSFDKYNLLAQASMKLQYVESDTHPLETSDANGLITYGYDNSDCLTNPLVVQLWHSDACFSIPDSTLIYNANGAYHSAKLSECAIFAGSSIDWNLYSTNDCTGDAETLSVYEAYSTDSCSYVSYWDPEPFPLHINGEYFNCIGSFEEQCSECNDEAVSYLSCGAFAKEGPNSEWCTYGSYEYCCGDDCCVSDGGAIVGTIVGIVFFITIMVILCCLCSSCCPHHDFWCRIMCCRKKQEALVIPVTSSIISHKPEMVSTTIYTSTDTTAGDIRTVEIEQLKK